MIKVANFFKKDVLRDVSYDEFMENYRIVRARVGDRPALRALHFFKEEDRVLKQTEALEKGDFDTFLKLVRESGTYHLKHYRIFIHRKVHVIKILVQLLY